MRQIKYSTGIALLVLVSLVTQGQMCSQSSQRKLLKAEDDAAVIIQKLEQARSIALADGKIDLDTAHNIDRALLKANTLVKKVSHAGDAYAANPTGTGTGGIRDAIRELRIALDEIETGINDGSLGVKNPDSRQSLLALVNSLRAVVATVEGIVAGLQKEIK